MKKIKKTSNCFSTTPPIRQTSKRRACDRDTAKNVEIATTARNRKRKTYQFRCSRAPKRACPSLWQFQPIRLQLSHSFLQPCSQWEEQMVHFPLWQLLHLHASSSNNNNNKETDIHQFSIKGTQQLITQIFSSSDLIYNNNNGRRSILDAPTLYNPVCVHYSSFLAILRGNGTGEFQHPAVCVCVLSDHHRWRHHEIYLHKSYTISGEKLLPSFAFPTSVTQKQLERVRYRDIELLLLSYRAGLHLSRTNNLKTSISLVYFF